MNKKLRALQKLFSLISGFSLIFNSLFPAGVLSLLFAPAAVAAAPESTSLSFSPGTSNFTLTVNAPTDNNPVDYVLSYFKTNTQTVEGVVGSGVTQLTRDILAGTCSGTTCIPHPFNRALTKVVIDEGSTKWCEVKEYTYDGSLTKKDETVTACSDPKEFTTLTDTETAWLKTGETVTPTPTPTTAPTSTPTPTPTQTGQILDGATTEATPTVTPTPTPDVNGHLEAAIIKHTNALTLDLNSTDIVGSAVLTTNKPDYAPTDTVVISGNGFVPKHPYKLFISSTDPPAVTFQTEIKTDNAGSFIYSYQLDGNYRPNYSVTVKEGNAIIASTTFTDGADKAPVLTITGSGLGDGAVTSNDGHFNCVITAGSTSGTCSFTYSSNNPSVTLTALANSGSTFVGWSGGCSGTGTCSPNGLTGTNTVTVSAAFDVGTTPDVGGGGTGNPAADLDQYDDVGNNWQNGNLSSSNYFEGDSVPYRLKLTNLSTGTHHVTIGWDTTDSSKHALDYITTYNRTVTTADPCLSAGFTCVGPTSTFAIPADPNVTGAGVTPIAGNLTLFGGTLTGVSAYTLSSTNSCSNNTGSYSGSSTTCITVTFTTSTPDLVLSWGGHIATRGDWGANNSAVAISGSPYHTRLLDLDGSGGNQDRSLSASAVTFPASITIVKQATPEGSTSFPFVASPTPLANFNLVDDGTTANTKVFSGITNFQSYTVTENTPAGWTLDNLVCSVTSPNGGSQTVNGATATINLKEGENVSCTYTNTQQSATITVNKTLSPSNDPGLFNLKIDGTTAGTGANVGDGGTTGAIPVLTTSTHTVSETAGTNTDLTNYTSTYSCNNNLSGSGTSVAAFSVTNGQSVVCTFTNTRKTGSLLVHKLVDTNSDGTFETTDSGANTLGFRWGFSATPTSNTTLFGSSQTEDTGSYSVYESAVTDYHLVGWYNNAGRGSCSVPDSTSLPANISVSSGNTTEITLCNAHDTGTIKIVKNTSGGDGTFDFNVSGATASTPSIVTSGGTGSSGPTTVITGTYTVSETVPTNWTLSSSSCTDGSSTFSPIGFTVGSGKNIVCSFNDTKQGTMIVKKVMVGGTDTFSFTGNPAGTINTNNGTITVNNVLPGSYTSTESTVSGWDLNSISCDDPRSTTPSSGDVKTGTATFNVDPGETVTCTFTNTARGHLEVTKITDPATDTTTQFTVTASGTGAITQSPIQTLTGGSSFTYEMVPGTYSVAETPVTGWDMTDNTCSDVVVSAGQTATCTITNTQRGSITVTKYQDNNANGSKDGGESVLSGWTINLTGQTPGVTDGNGQVLFGNLVPGTFTLSENFPDNTWIQSNISCTGDIGTDNSNSHTIKLAPGQNITCSIGNYQDGNIVVKKVVLDPSGNPVTDTSTSFLFTVNGSATANLTDDQTKSFSVTPGSLNSIVETPDANYTFKGCTSDAQNGLTIDNGISVTVSSGQTINVTCTNWQKSATINVDKVVQDANGKTTTDHHTFTAQLNSGNNQSFADNSPTSYTVNPGGPYTVGEVDPNPDYSLVGCKLPTGADASNMTLSSNQTVTVTCTNKQNPGTISGHKFMSDGTTGIVGWVINLYSCLTSGTNCNTFVATTTTGTGGAFSFTNLVTGFYKVIEDLTNPNYTPVSITSHDVTINPGTVSENNDFSNFKNIDITVCKKSDADGNLETTGDQNVLSGWTMTLLSDGKQLGDTQTTNRETGCTTFSNLGPDHDYSVTETLQEGWKNITPLTHDFGTPADGVNQSYTFYNQQLGHIVIAKVTDPAQNPQSFDFTLTGGASSLDQSFSLTDGTNHDSGYVIPGDGYNASETVPTGWDQTSATCDNNSSINNISVAAGQTTTCTFTNTKRGTIIVQKDMVGGTGSFDFTGDVEGSIDTNGGQLQTTNLIPGTYTSTETAQAGWDLTSLNCDDGESKTPSTTDLSAGTATFKVDPGETVTCTFTNTKRGKIIIHKIIDADGNLQTTDDQTNGVNWVFDLTGQTDISGLTTDNLGATSSGLIVNGNYDVTENVKAGFDLIDAQCDGGENGSQDGNTIYSVNVNPGQTVNCTFINSPNGKIHGYKWNDINGNGTYDCTNGEFPNCEDKLSGWTIFLDSNNNGKLDQGEPSTITQTGNELGWYVFDHLFPGTYHVCEVGQNGWAQTSSPTCHTIQVPTGENTCGGTEQNSILAPACNFGNKLQNPILTITKENNTGGADRHPGDSVLYTLTVTATQSAAFNVEVTDLLPAGFTYQAGSWTSSSSVRGNLKPGTTTEPTYHSPGVWKLGNMVVGEVVTLTYIANISGDQQSGLYHDLAWASGCRTSASCTVLDSNSVLSNATDPGFVDEHYVGTQVNIVREPSENVNLTVQGQVLGASTELPATGASALWLYIAFGLITSGLTFGALGWYIRRRHE